MRMDLLMKELDEKYHSAIAFLSFSEGARDLDGELTEGGKTRLKSFDKVPEPKRREQRRNSICYVKVFNEIINRISVYGEKRMLAPTLVRIRLGWV
jgi:hypothetical protein